MFSCRHSGVGGLTCWCMRRSVTGFSAAARASTVLCAYLTASTSGLRRRALNYSLLLSNFNHLTWRKQHVLKHKYQTGRPQAPVQGLGCKSAATAETQALRGPEMRPVAERHRAVRRNAALSGHCGP